MKKAIVNAEKFPKDILDMVQLAAPGDAFVIRERGVSIATLVVMETVEYRQPVRLGLLAGQYCIPDDFDSLGSDDIACMFGITE